VNEPRMAGTRVTLPPPLAARARELAAGRLTPAVPTDAATVILLRQRSGVEAYLLRRIRALDFAPGACVFPGGSVDAEDADPDVGWAGPSPADVADRLSTSPERARALVCAAVRETFEESGVLLAGPSPATLVDDSAALARDRHALLTGTTSFGELLGRRGLMLRADLLVPWTRWLTPEASPRRFDTWFFAAALPPGQTAALEAPAEHQDQGVPHGEPDQGQPGHGESDQGTWLRPAGALESARTGEITLLPPTAVTLGELATYDSVTAVLAQRRTMTMRMPRVMMDGDQTWLVLPPPEPAPGQPQEGQPQESQPQESQPQESQP
jgi:8-oxo-dGTP pyrophosphatase MutT (NUDIX family)